MNWINSAFQTEHYWADILREGLPSALGVLVTATDVVSGMSQEVREDSKRKAKYIPVT
ncbi:hypothetical protein ACFSJU_14990 [Paradesertivirga mongoliensis]|uniref:Uncharacterized protein n=1 Tax=Paradesertivirga mongoliensis TaxID=2100740 RepID=A0ABW4ZNN5_9SPHI|nr:hypothetical protein [Pedobacter mongoliensis]